MHLFVMLDIFIKNSKFVTLIDRAARVASPLIVASRRASGALSLQRRDLLARQCTSHSEYTIRLHKHQYRFSALWLRSKCSNRSYRINLRYFAHRVNSRLYYFWNSEQSLAC